MPRINIEDELFKDNRFMDLSIALKSREAALGALVSCWIVAQEHWKTSDDGIPKKTWTKQKLRQELITVGFAEDRGEFVYVCGSKKSFAWLREAVESGKRGGKKSARTKASRAASATVEGNQPSLSLSESSSVSGSESHYLYNDPKGEGSDELREIKSPVGYFIACYVNAYQQRYGETARPPLGGKVSGQIKHFLKDIPLKRACELIEVFMHMNDAWFLNKGHDFSTFLSNQAKVSLMLDTGSQMTGAKAREIERAQTSSDNWDKAARLVDKHTPPPEDKP